MSKRANEFRKATRATCTATMPSVTLSWFAGIALGVLGSAASALAQGVVAPLPQPGAAVRPPVARQIEPMVAPIHRASPRQVTTPHLAAPLAQRSAGRAPIVAGPHQASAPRRAPAHPVQAAAAAKPALPVASKPVAITAAVPATASPVAAGPKFVAHTCRIGQDYSAKLGCYSPGVTKVAGRAGAGVRGKLATVDTGGRSSLGAAKRR